MDSPLPGLDAIPNDRYPCPCCGYLVFIAPPGSYAICLICSWEDDRKQLAFPDMARERNHLSLAKAQGNYLSIGISDPRLKPRNRRPRPNEPGDPLWQTVESKRGIIKRPSPMPYDGTLLYYWRLSYWALSPQFPCPCCGYIVNHQPPGSYDICPICFWEDDLVQLRFPLNGIGANKVSLFGAQRNYAQFGTSEARLLPFVRPPHPEEQREVGWHMLDPDQDVIERPIRGVDYGTRYPEDYTVLYYWCSTYWLRYYPEGIDEDDESEPS